MVELVETPDVVAALGAIKQSQWMVAFALETKDHHFRALQKLERKNCDLIVLNGPEAMCAADTRVEVIDRQGQVVGRVGRRQNQGRPGHLRCYCRAAD